MSEDVHLNALLALEGIPDTPDNRAHRHRAIESLTSMTDLKAERDALDAQRWTRVRARAYRYASPQARAASERALAELTPRIRRLDERLAEAEAAFERSRKALGVEWEKGRAAVRRENARIRSERARAMREAAERALGEAAERALRKRQREQGEEVTETASSGLRRLSWTILPAADGNFEVFRRNQMLAGRPLSREAEERIRVLWRLRPKARYIGEELGHRLYYVAVFDGVVVAESPNYGNALYYYRCNDSSWQDVFSQEKQEARKLGAKRIIHTENWESELERVVGQTKHGSVRR